MKLSLFIILKIPFLLYSLYPYPLGVWTIPALMALNVKSLKVLTIDNVYTY